MKGYITIDEGFIDAIKSRVQTNVSNAADAVGTAMGYVDRFGKKISDTSNTITDGAQRVSNFVKGVNTPKKKEDIKVVDNKNRYEEDDDDEDYQNEDTMLTTSLIKRQIPNGKQNTLKPVQNIKPVKTVNQTYSEMALRFKTSLQKQATNSGFTFKSLVHDFPKKLQPPKDKREADIRHLIRTGSLPERDEDDYDKHSKRR